MPVTEGEILPTGLAPSPSNPGEISVTNTGSSGGVDKYGRSKPTVVGYPGDVSGWLFPVPGATGWGGWYPGTLIKDRYHDAVDIPAPAGSAIRAPVSGTVIKVGTNPSSVGGYTVTFQGDDGVTYYMAHMQDVPPVQVGARLSAGATLGAVGNSGNARSTGSHLHMRMYTNAGTVDPTDLINTSYGSRSQNVYPTGEGYDGTADVAYIPRGMDIYNVDGQMYAVGYITSPGGVQTAVYFKVTAGSDSITSAGTSITRQGFDELIMAEGWVDGKTTDAFIGSPPGMSWEEQIEQALFATGVYGTDMMNEKEVLDIIALWISRPDMSIEEFRSRIRATQYAQSLTEKQKDWNDKSKAEQDYVIMEEAGKWAGLMWSYAGIDMNMDEYDLNGDGEVTADELKKANPDLYQKSLAVASGTQSQQALINTWLKPEAEKNENSPWSRIKRDEEKAQGQHDVDIETQAAAVQEAYRDWGFEITWDEALKIGEQVVMNETSLAEIEQELDEKATIQYQGKPKGVKTSEWANPYLELYSNTLEVARPDLLNRDVQTALQQGMSLTDFKRQLRDDPRWMKTQQAKDQMFTTFGQLGRQMGF